MDQEMNYGEDYKFIPATSVNSGVGFEVLPDVYCHTIQIVNILLVGNQDTGDFVLVDAGMPNSSDDIIKLIEERFGEGSRPKAIVLTHGHFDHVGAIIELVEHWNIPVYAHSLELPYLTGKAQYPKPDASVEGGLVAKMSPFFPNEPVDLGDHVEALPSNGKVPYMDGFHWVHTPGHTPGHVSFFRDEDGALIVGDAFVTVKQENLWDVMNQNQEISGPPRYLTTDWEAAKQSVQKLASLEPSVAITGHGLPMHGDELTNHLRRLAQNFDELAKPDYGRYI
ncbi:MBL fold metallo-hydrolase [Aquisalibacillus elongatus]|uniref:Glyoxylase-like metal-dependent hydrolase (Beta-lactamase superfamily II) n=1 Tax=Aquisalibacillus elongatus TaxID=485577 RepID=A0A3N5B7K8_9BACI|nr:MBL fold metallo-hydrolase [Aquisalibacillus elongatus]RPF53424.1 glyoxylase-like metal-dependent hydrolase (beta-lactamase superfamily II) [Aquisalibacillus elongatus]